MADPITLVGIEEQHLIGLGHRIIAADMPHEDAAIGIDEARLVSAFLVALMAAAAIADDVTNGDGLRLQEQRC